MRHLGRTPVGVLPHPYVSFAVRRVTAPAFLALVLGVGLARAEWPTSPYQSVRVGPDPLGIASTYGLWLARSPIASDGAGGLIAAWPGGTWDDTDLIAHRVDATARLLWGSGARASNARGAQLYPHVVEDGAGGAFVVWGDWRGLPPAVYVQHVDGDGVPLWGPSGVAVGTTGGHQYDQAAVADGTGGVIVAWVEERDATSRVHAQRFDAEGTPAWGIGGRVIVAGTFPRLLPTGDGGCYIAWRQVAGASEPYAEAILRLNGAGNPTWSAPRVISDPDDWIVSLMGDGSGGVLVALGSSLVVRLDASGDFVWEPPGVRLLDGWGSLVGAVDDAAGGIYALLLGSRDFRLVRLGEAGAPVWAAPVLISTGSTFAGYGVALTADGVGGVIPSWIDSRTGEQAVYAARVDALGRFVWEPHTLAVCVQYGRKLLLGAVSDGEAGAIVAWSNLDRRDVRAQRVDASGTLQPVAERGPGAITLPSPLPNPSRASVAIRFSLREPSHTRVTVFDAAGRLVDRVFEGVLDEGPHLYAWSGYRKYRRVPAGAYFVRVEALGERAVTRVILLDGPKEQPGAPQ